MKYDCFCQDCGGLFCWDELIGEASEDSDGDMVLSDDSEGINLCPDCHGETVDLQP